MAPNPRVVQAFRTMKEIGISEEKVKPVLKKLLKLYDKNWELIESENYRVLADAIFEEEDSKVSEPKKSTAHDEDIDEEGSTPVELVRPLKRARLKNQEGLATCSHTNGSSNVAGTLLKEPKVEENEIPPASLQHRSLQSNVGNIRTEIMPASPGPVCPQPPSHAPVSPHHSGRDKGKQIVEPRPNYKGKEPMSPHVASKGKGPERASVALRIKDPAPEPGIIPNNRVSATQALIIPKEEPFTDDMPQDEVPLAVIQPDSLSGRDFPIGDFSTEKSNWLEPPESLHAAEIAGSSASASGSERHTSCEHATVPDEIPSILEIASSQLGEVTISLSYNSALGGPNFQLPSIDELRGLMELRCLQSYKLIDPNFDVIKILTDMCECISELATNSSNQSQEGNEMPALDVLKKSPSRGDAEKNKENGCCEAAMMLNESFDNHCSGNGFVDNVGRKELVVAPQHHLTSNELRRVLDASDITKGEENFEISWVNEINKEFPTPFQYISDNLVFQNAHVSFSLSRIGDERCCPTCLGDCLLSQKPCVCACQAGGKFAYTPEGVIKEDFLEECISMTRDPQKQCLLNCTECPLERSKADDFPEPCKGHLQRKVIKECWIKCGCNKQCGNRVVQRGVNYKLQVFLTPDGKGWGLRTLENLPKGAFVCEFVGEILTIPEFYARNREKHTSPVLLDAYWGLKGVPKDEEALCLDATCYGNVARFINHRCLDANLIEIPVEVETPDLHYYHLAFFTTREVHALEELTWDYGIDFDDLDHHVKTFQCRCGSKFCRNMKRSIRSKSATR
ncbi:probable inactive histone-lysine N-methyltransferase SUVR1 isoform X4 [Gossypium hirsutum]|uniref:Probable inactive histone-lysine N-methyltransferase SUVR1 isoform X2 n=1 Tax=Gossypium hirsutum TaxID=3635 RepID=A0A1U8N0D4_GOSHI|nr:probable inactive histone-lysine N-methyltransferase SUVR1 isoform X4 [Gossypium hirsutum]XP_040954661.1 probable inactive histone-lysine N-methyltransferase SUVR1 isoform X4 [Gossypium hirsutum]XP_040954663.1 probable inactive histone-lysine N-methyltransferase SUVR1 isoform X4 [Gossypium hirsutum]XP_040954664.1 probable inactive histone-lysine N-methyltransferase SUVR1 isoform X4 [Gossypium hirsutum]